MAEVRERVLAPAFPGRCEFPTLGPPDWNRGYNHDGHCKRLAKVAINDEFFCNQHAAVIRRQHNGAEASS